MKTLEWFEKLPKRALTPINYGSIPFCVTDPDTSQIPDDAPEMPNDDRYVLFVAVYQGETAHYWIKESVMDDSEVDIWAEIWPTISKQLGYTNA